MIGWIHGGGACHCRGRRQQVGLPLHFLGVRVQHLGHLRLDEVIMYDTGMEFQAIYKECIAADGSRFWHPQFNGQDPGLLFTVHNPVLLAENGGPGG